MAKSSHMRGKMNRFLRALFSVPQDLYLSDTSGALDTIFRPFDQLCDRLARWFLYFRPRVVVHTLFSNGFTATGNDARENFIPVRIEVLRDAILQDVKDAHESELLDEFIKLSAARFHFDYHETQSKLRDLFAPFDLDSETQFEPTFSPEEREQKRQDFTELLKNLLVKCNYFELPRDVMDRVMSFKRPGMVPVVANYDDYSDYYVYARGVVPTPDEKIPRWKCGGEAITIKSERISRICVIARLKPEKDDSVDDADSLENTRTVDAPIVVKLFKDVELERLNMVAPRVKLRFPLFDGIKIGGTFFAGVTTAVIKLILAAAFTMIAFVVLATAFILASFKSVMGFVNRRTAYLQKYARRLYFHMIASNLAVVDVLVNAAEEQEVKEFILGYVAALRRGEWSTEREIDDDVESWLREKFGLEIDFESNDALNKLIDKKTVLRKQSVELFGDDVVRYRAVPLENALTQLDEDWDNFFQYNV